MQQIILNGLDASALYESIRGIIRYELDQQQQLLVAKELGADKLLTIREAAELLDICVASVHELKRKGVLPFYRLGGRSYLKQAEILAALQSHQHTVKTAISSR